MNVTCAICTSNLSETDELRVTTCGHLYHNGCIGKWLARSQTCPECRVHCTPPSLIRLFLNVDRKTKPVQKETPKPPAPNPPACNHQYGRMWCLDHQQCKSDCRSPMDGIHLTSFFYNNGNGCLYCFECAHLRCTECDEKLDDTIVRYKRRLYHVECFPCQKCREPLENRDAKTLLRPSKRFHTDDDCLYCEWCKRGLVGELYAFKNDLPICQDCMD